MVELVGAWTGFCLIHSITASLAFKAWIARIAPGIIKYYELFYVGQSLVLFGVVGYFYVLAGRELGAQEIVWKLPVPIYLNYALALWALLLVAFTKVTARSIIQPKNAKSVIATSANPFIKTGAYAISRHPMYLFVSMALFFLPLNKVQAVSAVFITGYFYLGTYLEEAKLVIEFGDEYRDYQRKVSRFIPIRYFSKLVKEIRSRSNASEKASDENRGSDEEDSR